MNHELATEVKHRVDAMRADPAYMDDNDNPGDAALELFALEDIEAMGDDFGGHFPDSIDREGHAAWRKLRRAAMREIAVRHSRPND